MQFHLWQFLLYKEAKLFPFAVIQLQKYMENISQKISDICFRLVGCAHFIFKITHTSIVPSSDFI